MSQTVLYLTPDADRLFLVPAQQELPAGDFTVATLDGRQRLVDALAIMRFEVSQAQAQTHFRTVAESVMDLLSGTVSDSLATSHPSATVSALERLAGEVRAVAAGLSTGDAENVRKARETLSRRGIELGDGLDELTRYLQRARQSDEPGISLAPKSAQQTARDEVQHAEAGLGRRVDASIERLERTLGPLTGLDAAREQQRQQRQEVHERSARSAIAEALRMAGIAPLSSADEPLTRPD
ncbi:MAG: hypothetical protein ACR2IK_16375 [Chloroflexota bacterium]